MLHIFVPLSLIAQDSPPIAQPPVPASRPRIGLALSGGGALALAEIGVIRWMEENHIPVDRIAGTSMGSIIGAMYATGMSPDEIQKFAEKIDWDEAFLPEPVYRQLSYRRKQDRRDFLIAAPLGLKHGLSGPNGFNSGQGVGLLLDRIAFPESGVASFDDLPIPFRCVATDMLSGEGVVLTQWPIGAGSARFDGDPGRVHSGGDQWPRVGRRRHGAEHSSRDRSRHGCGRRDRGRVASSSGKRQRTGNSYGRAYARRRRDDHAE